MFTSAYLKTVETVENTKITKRNTVQKASTNSIEVNQDDIYVVGES